MSDEVNKRMRALIAAAGLAHQHRCGEGTDAAIGCGRLLNAWGREPSEPKRDHIWSCVECAKKFQAMFAHLSGFVTAELSIATLYDKNEAS